MATLVDTHCHLDFSELADDLDGVLLRSSEAGVTAIITIGIDPGSWERTRSIVTSHADRVVAAYGVHPNSVAEHWSRDTVDQLELVFDDGGAPAVGEIGLDFYRGEESADLQREAFVTQLEIAQRRDLPVIIHMRAAEDELIETLQEFAPVRGVLHSFASDWGFAKRCLDVGLMLGVGGISTYPSAQNVRDALLQCPHDRLLLETDSPFLAPQPHRGRSNEPAYVAATASLLADLLNIEIDELADATTRNACELFGRPVRRVVDGTVNV